MSYRGYRPRILWGTSYTNALDFGYPLDSANAYSAPREGSEVVQLISGVEDASLAGEDYYLAGEARWIPEETGLSPRAMRASGWNGTDGWRAFLHWARAKNALRYYPVGGHNLLVSPALDTDSDSNSIPNDWTGAAIPGTVTASRFVAVDGSRTVHGVTVTASTGAATVETTQFVYGFEEGEALTFSCDYRNGTLTNCHALLIVEFLNAGGTQISAAGTASLNNTSGTYTRASVATTVPASTYRARVYLRVTVTAAGASGTINFSRAMLERASSASSTFLDSPSVSAYLVDPWDAAPLLERNAERRLPLLLRSASEFTGY